MKTKKILFFLIIFIFLFFFSKFSTAQVATNFVYPLDKGILSQESKFAKETYPKIYHLGDDFLAPAGTPVKAFADGIVKHVGIHLRFGTVVLIEHTLSSGKKIVSLYGHLRRNDIQVLPGQFVNMGEVIGFVGKAGQENGGWMQEHLHFAIRRGEYVDVKTKWVYWGYGPKEELKNWYNPSKFLTKRISPVDPQNLAKILTAPANNAPLHIQMFDQNGKKIKNSDLYATRRETFSGGDIALARLDQENNLGIVVGLGKKVSPYVKIYDKKNKILLTKFLAFSEKYKRGVRVAAGDINGDGIDEIIVGSQGKIRTEFKIFDKQGNLILKKYLFPKKSKKRTAIDVAAGDVDGDKVDEIIVGRGFGEKPYVMIFKPDGTLIYQFLAYQKNFHGGIKVASGDVDGDGKDEIVTGAGLGGGPHLRVFNGNGSALPISFFPFHSAFRGGIDVATGDVDGDGKAEIITAPNSAAEGWVKVYRVNSENTILTEFLAYERIFQGGINVAGIK